MTPSSHNSAAPTAKAEYGEYECSRAARAAAINFASSNAFGIGRPFGFAGLVPADFTVTQEANRKDAPTTRPIDLQTYAIAGLDFFAFVRQAAKKPDGQTADRLEVFVRQVQPEPRVDVFDVRAGVDDRFVVGDRPDRLFLAFVVLVAYLADDLLEQILHRH